MKIDTFDQARRYVADNKWSPPEVGTYHVSDSGYEDADGFIVFTGAREFLVEGRDDYAPGMDHMVVTVDRDGGAERVNYIDLLRRIARADPVTV